MAKSHLFIHKKGEKHMKDMSLKELSVLKEKYQKKPVQQALRRVLVKNELVNLFDKAESKPSTQFRFSHEIKTLPVTYQKQSGQMLDFCRFKFN
jgi:bleomycin hydrolase